MCGDILGHAADVWGQEPRVIGLSSATAMILPWLMILCAHECLWCRCQSFLPSAAFLRSERRSPFLDVLESRRDEDPSVGWGLRGLNGSGRQVGRSAGMWLRSTPRGLRASSLTIS